MRTDTTPERKIQSASSRSKSPCAVRNKLLAVLKDKTAFLKSARRSFEQFDTTRSGALGYGDVAQLVARLCENLSLPPIDDNILEHIFKKYDIENDGYLTLEEFIQFYWRLLWRVQEKYYPNRDLSVRRELFVGRHPLQTDQGISEIFDMEEMIGRGSFGEVYLVREKDCNDLVRVCKVINKSQAAVPMDQIEAEINVLKRLDHPNVIKIYDVYEDPQCVYIIMEYCRGGELLEKILNYSKEGRVMTEQYTAYVMYQVFKALSYFHRKNVVHKDLKPENILFHDPTDPAATIKVIDFGLAEIFHTTRRHRNSCPAADLDEQNGSELTICNCGGGESVYSHNAAGTVLYMAPEVFQRRLHLKCDVWSAGCLMYLMLTGHLPYSGKSVGEIRAKVLASVEPKFLRNGSAPFLSEACVDLMRLCLEKNVKRRPTAAAVLDHPWFRSFTPQLNPTCVRLPAEYIKNFKRISKVTAIRLCILNLVAHQLDLTNSRVLEIGRIFTALDQDHDGTLSAAELADALGVNDHSRDGAGGGSNGGGSADGGGGNGLLTRAEQQQQQHTIIVSPWEFNRIFQNLDVDSDGEVSYTEFLAAAYSWTQSEMNLIWTAFNKLDNGSQLGKLSVDHLVQVLSADDKDPERVRVLKKSIKKLDTNNDDFIDWQEFIAYVRAGPAEKRSSRDRLNNPNHLR